MLHCTAILHVAFEDLDAFEPVLLASGYHIEYLQAGITDLTSAKLRDTDLVFIMGGPIGANDEAMYPFLADELRLIEYRIRRNLPTFGICLGAQLIARTLGSRVYTGLQGELGWEPLTLTAAAERSCMQLLSEKHTQVLHWHNDTFDLPEGAIHLASTKRCVNQAFSYGPTVMALQFHPEVSAQGMERWLIAHTAQIRRTPGVSVQDLRAETVKQATRLNLQAGLFLHQWLHNLSIINPADEAAAC